MDGLRDTGRRGAPLPGCDCVVCFGYCAPDPEKAARDRRALRQVRPAGTSAGDDAAAFAANVDEGGDAG